MLDRNMVKQMRKKLKMAIERIIQLVPMRGKTMQARQNQREWLLDTN
jgi:hypothetical protein